MAWLKQAKSIAEQCILFHYLVTTLLTSLRKSVKNGHFFPEGITTRQYLDDFKSGSEILKNGIFGHFGVKSGSKWSILEDALS